MLLVYAMTRAAQHGWGSSSTVGLLAVSALLLFAFLGIELRSKTPLLPLRIFRQRTLAAANAAGVAVAAVGFSLFFLLTLYLQEVLHYSAIQTGAAFVAITLTIVVVSNVAQALVSRLGPRRVLTTGLLVSAAALAWLARLPVHGHYLTDVLPALVLGGVGMALSFVSMTIAGLTGVERSDAGVASGLINTSRQIGGAVGLAAVSTIAATSSHTYAASHTVAALSGSALTHGFGVAFQVLIGLAIVGALTAALFIERPVRPAEVESFPAAVEAVEVQEAA
jgi:predicted MFS family arabinose efflux permease